MKKRMNIQTKLFLTAFVFAIIWLWVVWVSGAMAHCVDPNGFLANAHNYDCPNHNPPTSLTPQYPNPNDNPNNGMQFQQQQQQQFRDFQFQQQQQQQFQQQMNQQQLLDQLRRLEAR